MNSHPITPYDPLQKIERSDLVCKHGKAIIDYCSSNEPSQVATFLSSFISLPLATVHKNIWSVYEDVCFAAMDAHLPDVRNWCLQQLEAKYPRSMRALRLRGQVYESAEQWNDALAMYKQVLAKDPADMFVWRRHIAVLRASQQLEKALQELQNFCARFPEDLESVEELYLMCTHAGDHTAAQHAAETLVLTRPEDARYSVLLANSLYAQAMYVEARHYYAQALELRRTDRRAAMGILAVRFILIFHSPYRFLHIFYLFMCLSRYLEPLSFIHDLIRVLIPTTHLQCLRATGEDEPHLPALREIALSVLCPPDTKNNVSSAVMAMTSAAVNKPVVK